MQQIWEITGVRSCRSLPVTCTYPQSIEFSRTDVLRDLILVFAVAVIASPAVIALIGAA